MNTQPLVTIFSAIYNTNPEYTIRAIQSIQAQSYKNLEHIIVDDASPNPAPKEVVKDWIAKNHYQCTFIERAENFGICKTLNHALKIAKGKYICFCSDDILDSEMIQEQVSIAEKNNQIAVVFSRVEYFGSNVVNTLFPEEEIVVKLNSNNGKDLFIDELINKNFIPAIGCLINIEKVLQIGGYDESINIEDYDLWLRLLYSGYDIKFNPKVLAYYRVHSSGFSYNIKNWDKDLIKIFSKHLAYSKKALKRVEDIVLNAYKRDDVEILEFIRKKQFLSFKLKLILYMHQIRFPKSIGYKLLWRL